MVDNGSFQAIIWASKRVLYQNGRGSVENRRGYGRPRKRIRGGGD